jgi:hypothetical protein
MGYKMQWFESGIDEKHVLLRNVDPDHGVAERNDPI